MLPQGSTVLIGNPFTGSSVIKHQSQTTRQKEHAEAPLLLQLRLNHFSPLPVPTSLASLAYQGNLLTKPFSILKFSGFPTKKHLSCATVKYCTKHRGRKADEPGLSPQGTHRAPGAKLEGYITCPVSFCGHCVSLGFAATTYHCHSFPPPVRVDEH